MDELILSDLSKLMESWGKSYSFVPSEAREIVADAFKKLNSGYLTKITTEYFRYKVADEIIVEKMMYRTGAICLEWAMLCFAIGAESHTKNLDDDSVPKYLKAITFPLSAHLAEYMEPLLARGMISQKRGQQLSSELGSDLGNFGVFLANQGFVFSSEMKPKYGKTEDCPFVEQLKAIVD